MQAAARAGARAVVWCTAGAYAMWVGGLAACCGRGRGALHAYARRTAVYKNAMRGCTRSTHRADAALGQVPYRLHCILEHAFVIFSICHARPAATLRSLWAFGCFEAGVGSRHHSSTYRRSCAVQLWRHPLEDLVTLLLELLALPRPVRNVLPEALGHFLPVGLLLLPFSVLLGAFHCSMCYCVMLAGLSLVRAAGCVCAGGGGGEDTMAPELCQPRRPARVMHLCSFALQLGCL
jgi:hypothetical protein